METIKIKLTDIPVGKPLTGYLWVSDQPYPKKFIEEPINILPADNENPFIVEGNLYDDRQQLSYSIQYIDGEYLVFRFNMNDPDDIFTAEQYIPHHLDGVDKICFMQYWTAEKDKFCEEMEVLKPTVHVFVGF